MLVARLRAPGPGRCSADLGEQPSREPLLHEDAIGFDDIGHEREPCPIPLLPLEDDAGVRAGGVRPTTDPAVPTTGGHRRYGVLEPPS